MKRKKNSDKPMGIIGRLSGEVSGNIRLVEIYSDYEAVISGCVGIIDYNPCEVFIETVSGKIKIYGKCLCIRFFQQDMISVEGKIDGIIMG